MAEALISVVVELLTPFLLEKLKNEVQLVLGTPEDVQELHDTFDKIKYVLVDAEKRHIQKVLYNMEKGETGKAPESAWLEKLKDVSYQMEDVLDEWHTKLMKLEIDEGSDGVDTADRGKKKVQTTGKGKNKVWACFTSPCSCIIKGALHHKIGSRILELKERLDKLEKEKNTFKFKKTKEDVERQIRLAEDRRDEGCMIKLSEVCGRDLEKTKLINMLLSKSSNAEENIPVISIIGMGGIGKTTLAQCIFSVEKVKNHFQMKMWVCVSDPFDLTKIVKAIIEEAGDTVSNGTNTWNSLSKQLRKAVEGKLFLLVLDDVWTEDRTSWERLKLALDFGKDGSRIIVTTRNDAVADAVGTNASDKHMIEKLSDEDCWSLFQRLAFKEVKEYDYRRLQEIGRDISDKCKGLPLLAKTLGSLMPTKKTTDEWEEVLRSDIWDLPLVNKGVLPPLLLSYNALPSHLKRCFTYCAVFAKDTEIKKDTLIKMWMAEGCLGSTETSELEEIGERYFTDLVMRSFFQELEFDWNGHVRSCKMHDLLHDLATFLGNNEFATFLGNNECLTAEAKGIRLNNPKLRHLCVQRRSCEESINSIWRFKSLRTLLAKDSSFQDWAQMSNLTCLRTLDLYDAWIEELPKEVEKLIHLRYLNLSHTGIKELPETITNLCNLQTLNLYLCSSLGVLPNSFGKLVSLRHLNLSFCEKIKELPETITNLCNLQTLVLWWCESLGGLPNSFGKLVSLRHLDISGCHNFSKGLPRGIRKLRELRTLPEFVVSEEGCDLGELKDLSNLCGSLQISNIRGIGDEALGVMNSKRYLQGLCLRFSSESEDSDLKALEMLEPHSDLRELEILGYSGFKFPSWMEFVGTKFTMLRRLRICNCSKLKVLPALAELQFLEYLCLNDLKSVAPMGVEVVGDSDKMSASNIAFPNLKKLGIRNMINWEEWVIDTRSKNITLMPCLQTLKLRDCRMLKSLPWQLLSSSSLRKLRIEKCPNLVVSRLPPFLEKLNLGGDAGSLSKSLPVESGPHTIWELLSSFSFREIKIWDCPSLVVSCLLHCLKKLDLWGDAGSLSKSLPAESGPHTNLKHLAIRNTQQSTLPKGVSQLAALQTLEMIGSSILAGRYKKGEGEDWNIISHIPNIIITDDKLLDES